MNSNLYRFSEQTNPDNAFDSHHKEPSEGDGEFLSWNCGTCMYYQNNMCTHPMMQQHVNQQPIMQQPVKKPCEMDPDMDYSKYDDDPPMIYGYSYMHPYYHPHYHPYYHPHYHHYPYPHPYHRSPFNYGLRQRIEEFPIQQQQPPKNPPPSYTPKLTDVAEPNLTNVEFGAITPCIFRFTYLWLKNGQSFWSYLVFISRTLISGWQYIGGQWIYFNVNIKDIKNFICS